MVIISTTAIIILTITSKPISIRSNIIIAIVTDNPAAILVGMCITTEIEITIIIIPKWSSYNNINWKPCDKTNQLFYNGTKYDNNNTS